jgi:hypothetical protein
MPRLSNNGVPWTLSPLVNAYYLLRLANPELKEFANIFAGVHWNVRPDGAWKDARNGWKLCMRRNSVSQLAEAIVTSPDGTIKVMGYRETRHA